VELNPLLYFVARVKTTPVENISDLSVAFREVIPLACTHFETMKSLDTGTFLIEYDASIPKIRNVTKWWSPLILKKLVALRIALATLPLAPIVADFLNLAVISILIEVSNARYNHPSLSFARTCRDDVPVFERFQEQVEMMISEILSFSHPRPETVILRGNSKHLERILPMDSTFDAIITSPPYPNRFSYARETRPQMFYLGLVKSGREVGQLETEAIGGTWGKATSILGSHFEYASPVIRKALRGIPEQVGEHSYLMQNYVIKYFNDIEQHIRSLKPFVRPGADLAYVIGNSKFYRIVLPSDEILADIFEAHGFQITSIERMRRRNSKSGLYEAIIFMKRGNR